MVARNLVSMATAACAAMLAGAVDAAPANNRPYASDAHRGLGGAYGTMKRIPQPRDLAPKRGERREPYPYRYYSDTDRSPSSCRRYAQRAIATKNANWWTRYRACLN